MIQKGTQDPTERELQTTPPDGRPRDAQPRWRKDFPIAWPQDEWISRRELTKFIVLTSGALAVGQLWIVVKSLIRPRGRPFPALTVATVEELPVGGAKTFTYPPGSPPRLLIRTGAWEFVAYDQQCTHLQCPVVPQVEHHRLHCPCHDGEFDLKTGEVLAGPPQRALPKVTLEIRGNEVVATGIEEPLA
jgi:nitrite reductase/ring-hydroxylating ferredoxin subunit